jgi:hypothetical protein
MILPSSQYCRCSGIKLGFNFKMDRLILIKIYKYNALQLSEKKIFIKRKGVEEGG